VLFLGASSLKPEKAIESSFPAKKTTLSGLTPPRIGGLGPFSPSIDTLVSSNYHPNISPTALFLYVYRSKKCFFGLEVKFLSFFADTSIFPLAKQGYALTPKLL
jgi:hypothetical protein